jgi:hypothetical protein
MSGLSEDDSPFTSCGAFKGPNPAFQSGDEPRFPQTKAEAVALLPEWETALIFARCEYDRRRQQARTADDRIQRLRGQMAVIRDMIAGSFDEAEEQRYAQGSRGPWPINGYTAVQTEEGGS